MPERKTESPPTFLGVTNGEWIGLAVMVIAFSTSYAVTADNVKDNTATSEENAQQIQAIRKEVRQEIKESEERTEQHINDSEQRTRSDIRDLRLEIRQILLRNSNGQ